LIRGRGMGYIRETKPLFNSLFVTGYFEEEGMGIGY